MAFERSMEIRGRFAVHTSRTSAGDQEASSSRSKERRFTFPLRKRRVQSRISLGSPPVTGKKCVPVGFATKNRFRLRNGFSSRFQDNVANA